jgi:hypothetical protein
MQLDGLGNMLPGRVYGRELNCCSFPGQAKGTTCSCKKPSEYRVLSGSVSRGTVTTKRDKQEVIEQQAETVVVPPMLKEKAFD